MLKKHINGCGLVEDTAHVEDSAYVGPAARVSGRARVYGIMRSDGHCFAYVPCSDGKLRVIAGCRYFTMREARKHWKETRGGTALGEETFIILKALAALQKVQP